MSKNKIFFGFFFILLIALFFRFYKITQVPISLNWDEAVFAYNAYSILETGKDEYGKSFPLEFKSVGDYKCPIFVYLTAPLIKIFGLNEFTIRFWSSVFGALSAAVFFLLIFELFSNYNLAILSGLTLSVSPWHLQFTRAQGDVAISSFLVVLATWQFVLWLNRQKSQNLYFSAVAFGLTFYAYFAERFFVPIFLLGLFIVFRQQIWLRKQAVFKAGILGLLTLLPILFIMLSSGQQSKIMMTTIFGYIRPSEYLNKMRQEDLFPIIFKTFHPVLVEYPLMILDRYFNHFSPSFLFIKGPPDDRQKIFGMGMLYWSDALFLGLALYSLIQGFKNKKSMSLLFVWLLVAPLPSVITRDPVHARRAFNLVYPLSFFIAWGINYLLTTFKQKVLLLFGLGMFVLWSMTYYFFSYYFFTPLRTYAGPGGWNYGYKELVQFISPLKSKYKKVIIDTSYQGPYLFFLFYEKYPPALYQPQAVLVKKEETGLGEGKGYDNYEFRSIYWPADRGIRNALFAGSPETIPLRDLDPKQAKLLKTIYFPDGKPAFYVVETL